MESSVQFAPVDPSAVQAKAYELWEAKGRPEGVAEQTWHEAEQQLALEATLGAKQAGSAPEQIEAAPEAPASEPPSSPNPSATTQKKSSNSGRRTRR